MSELRLHNFIPYRLSVAANAVSRRISDSYRRRFGLKIAEWRVIAILAEHDRMTPQDIGNKGELDKITVSRSATALIAPNPASACADSVVFVFAEAAIDPSSAEAVLIRTTCVVAVAVSDPDAVAVAL
ncbi:MAG: MarR family transcriptional regulator [Sphingomonadaceae bacterium]|nr:MarR family transcriptional regulator [Sphingomonadaceae bacterium]